MLAPIVIFAFNRPDSLLLSLKALKTNPESKDSDLFIFVDGYRKSKVGEKDKVRKVQEICKTLDGFKSVSYKFSDENKGLGTSIILGVSEIINRYGKVIVLEDDLITQPNFLSFMNQGLERYETDSKVFSVCGYTNRVVPPVNYEYDAYFCTRSSSWGWATWKDRWNSIDWSFDRWEKWMKLKDDFNRWGGSDCFGMLDGCRVGRNKSWAIRFCFNQFLQDKLSLFPTRSLVINDGFDGLGTNCKKYSRFKYDLMSDDKSSFLFPKEITLYKSFHRQAMRYHSVLIRIWSRIMYHIYR